MHNLHVIIVNAENPRGAAQVALSMIEDFGNDNNWRDAIAVVDENWKFTINNIGYSIDKLDSLWLKDFKDNQDFKNVISEMVDMAKQTWKWAIKDDNFLKPAPYSFWSKIEEAASIMKEETRIEDMENFNLFEDEFFPFQYNKFGITNAAEDGPPKFAVYIDMHS